VAEIKKTKKQIVVEPHKVSIDVGDGAAIPLREDVGLFTAWRVASSAPSP
jgi:hypothetical protein